MDQNIEDGTTTEEIMMKQLCMGPSARVTTWQAYDINGYTFYTSAKDRKSQCKNSGIRIDAIDDSMGQKVTYFGVIDKIWELDYGLNIQIPVFKCQWVKHPQGVEVDNYGLTIVDLANVGYKEDPWVLGIHVAQVLYILEPSQKKQKHIVASGKQSIIGVDGVDDIDAYNRYDALDFFTDLPNKIKSVETSLNGVKPWLHTDGDPKIVTA